MEKKKNALVVVAIDFGTTFSGYAYSFRDEYKRDPTKIYSNVNWHSSDGLMTSKTPTIILFDAEKNFHMFGYEAETKYNRLLDDGKADGWRYFRLFKMKLFREEKNRHTKAKISKRLMIEDEQNRTMPALIVFSECIKYLKDHFLNCYRGQIMTKDKEPENDVHWVLTVPAIWTDGAKQFMREASIMAGIDDNMLTLAYEPEAAALYCKELTVQKKDGAESSTLSSFEPGQQFLVLDCGGGTVDITVYQIQNDGDLRELERPTGGPWGGNYVNNQYLYFLQELFGKDVWEGYAKENPENILYILRTFEAKKRSIVASSTDQTTIPFPYSLFTKFQDAKKCNSVQDGINKSRYADTVTVSKEKLRFDHKLVKDFFKDPVDLIVQHLINLLRGPTLRKNHIQTILMVGGFSDSSVLSDRIKAEFESIDGLSVIRPNDAVNVIMKGAVIFGHNPNVISERIAPRTYGISTNKPFDERVHPEKLKDKCDGRVMCTDIFDTIVQIGNPIMVDKQTFTRKYNPTRRYDTEATIELYESTEKYPMYTTDESVCRLGELSILLPDISKGKNRSIEVEISFGYTEIRVRAVEEGTLNSVEAKFDCLLN